MMQRDEDGTFGTHGLHPEPVRRIAQFDCTTCNGRGIRTEDGVHKACYACGGSGRQYDNPNVNIVADPDVPAGTRIPFDPSAFKTGSAVSWSASAPRQFADLRSLPPGSITMVRFGSVTDHLTQMAIQEEQERSEGEPYAMDDALIKTSDSAARGYMAVWSHYECAYNATEYRRALDEFAVRINDLLAAIMGHEVQWQGEGAPAFARVLWDAGQERARLLSQINALQQQLEALKPKE